MSDLHATPDWCPDGFVEFLEHSLVAHRQNARLIREGVEKGVFPEQMLADQETLTRRSEELLVAVRNGDREAFERISSKGMALSAAMSDQARALHRDRTRPADG